MALKDDMKNSFPNGIDFPEELSMLCDWVESNGTDISAGFSLTVNDDVIKYWFGSDSAVDDLSVFAHDYDGSLYAVWKNNGGFPKIVFLGSEGEPLLILADNFVDFLCLLAIGYDEVGFSDLTIPPKKDCSNKRFKTWVQETFKVEIPQTGDRITNISDLNFAVWVKEKLNSN